MTNSAGHLTLWLRILQQTAETEVTYKSQKSHTGFFTLLKKHLRYSETPKEFLITCSDADPAEEHNSERHCYREVSYIQTSWETSSLRLGERDCSNPELHPSKQSQLLNS